METPVKLTVTDESAESADMKLPPEAEVVLVTVQVPVYERWVSPCSKPEGTTACLTVPWTSKASTLMYLPAVLLSSRQILTSWSPAAMVPVSQTFC